MIDQFDAKAEGQRLADVARSAGLVLLYHGVWPQAPAALGSGVHNVSPERVAAQLELLKQHFQIVTVDEFAEARSTRGLAAVSFDDGYRAISQHAFAVFEALEVPFTVYLNGSSFRGRVFWRDKVRFIDESGLIPEFEKFMRGIDPSLAKRFYRYTKHPLNNSVHVNREIDRFLDARGLTDRVRQDLGFCYQSVDELMAHPLVAYGNHSESHFVMASLTPEEQQLEIARTDQLLRARRDITLSQVFSIPFGADSDFNEHTIHAARQQGYTGVLLSRGRIHHGALRLSGLPAYERFMPRQTQFLPRH